MFAGTTVRLVFRMIADCARLRIAMPTTLQRPFPDQYLLAYSADHVFYEVDHFFWLADVISRPTTIFSAQSPDAAVRTKNIFIEGFGLHLRNIIDFLYPRRLRVTDTDIVAADFLPNGKWDAIKTSDQRHSDSCQDSSRQRNSPSHYGPNMRYASREGLGVPGTRQ